VTINAKSAEMTYGENPTLGYEVLDKNGKPLGIDFGVQLKVNGKVMSDLSKLNVGTYLIEVAYNTVNGYTVTTENSWLTVNKAEANVVAILSKSTVEEGYTDELKVTVIRDVKEIADGTYTITNAEGTESDSLTGLPAGVYTITPNVTENGNYAVNVTTATLTVKEKPKTEVTITATLDKDTMYVGDAEPVVTVKASADVAGLIDQSYIINGDEALTLTEAVETAGTYTIKPLYNEELTQYHVTVVEATLTVLEKQYAAQIGDEKFETLQEAVNAAEDGATITLLKSGEVAMAAKNVTVYRGEQLFTATVSALTGYTPIETDNEYIIIEASALQQNKGPVAAYIDAEGYGTSKMMTLQDALDTAATFATAENNVVVKLSMDFTGTNKVGAIIIPSHVVLNIESHTLEADRVIGLNGSKIAGTTDSSSKDGVFTGGLLKVPVGNLVLSEEPYNDGTFDILPIWDPDENVLAYRFSRFNANTSGNAQGLYIKAEENKIEFKWNHQATGEVNKQLLSDSFGADDNELSIIVRIQWENDTGVVKQDYVYNAGFVQTLASNKDNKNWDYALTIAGYKSLGINMEKLRVIPMIVTNSGATSAGKQWTEENSK